MKRWWVVGLAVLFFVLGLLLVVLWPRAVKWGVVPAWPWVNQSLVQKEPTFIPATVVSWQPEAATLTHTAAGAQQTLIIQPLRPMVALTQG